MFKHSPRISSRKNDLDVVIHEEAIEMQDLVTNISTKNVIFLSKKYLNLNVKIFIEEIFHEFLIKSTLLYRDKNYVSSFCLTIFH